MKRSRKVHNVKAKRNDWLQGARDFCYEARDFIKMMRRRPKAVVVTTDGCENSKRCCEKSTLIQLAN